MKSLSIFIAIVLLCVGQLAWGQKITKAEYFFDTDPGVGKAIPLVLDEKLEMVEQMSEIPTTDLQPGFHKLSIRTQNENGVWSLTMARPFYIEKPVENRPEPLAIVGGEYFFNEDPGTGMGVSFSLEAGNVTEDVFEIPLKEVPEGFHYIGFRTIDKNEVWSVTMARSFYVFKPNETMPEPSPLTMGEYFIGEDPGHGKATSFTFESADNIALTIPTELEPGFHKITFRIKDKMGVWSQHHSQNFFIFPKPKVVEEAPLVAIEYTVQNTEGTVLAEGMPLEPTMVYENDFVIPLEQFPVGAYTISFHAIDKNGIRSLSSTQEFEIVDYGLQSFAFPQVQIEETLDFNMAERTVFVEIDPNADITTLKPMFTTTAGTKVFLGESQIIPGLTPIDFTFPVELMVVNSIGEEYTWAIEVYQRQLGAEKEIVSLNIELPGGGIYQGYIEDASTYAIYFNEFLNASEVKIHFELSELASLFYNDEMYNSGELILDLTAPAMVVVKAENGTQKEWNIKLELFNDNMSWQSNYIYNIKGEYQSSLDLIMNTALYKNAPTAIKDIENIAPLSGQQNEYDFIADLSSPNESNFVKISSIDAEFINSYIAIEKIYLDNVPTEKVSNLVVGDYFIVKLRNNLGYALAYINSVYPTINSHSDYIGISYRKFYFVESVYDVVASFEPHDDYGYDYLSTGFYNYSTNASFYLWDFDGDGNNDSEEKEPNHEYTEPGEYTVRLVAGNKEKSDTAYWDITVESSIDPCAGFEASLYYTENGLMAEAFGGSGSYSFYLDGKSDVNSDGLFPDITSGDHYVEVYDNTHACYASASVESVIARFEPSSDFGYDYLYVNFSNFSENAESFEWDLDGDGKTDMQDFEPYWEYTEPGEYTVRLIARNGEQADTSYHTIYIYQEDKCNNFGVSVYSEGNTVIAEVWGGSGNYTYFLNGNEVEGSSGIFNDLDVGYYHVYVIDNEYECEAEDGADIEDPTEFFEYVLSVVNNMIVDIEEADLVNQNIVSQEDFSELKKFEEDANTLLNQLEPSPEAMETLFEGLMVTIDNIAKNESLIMVSNMRLSHDHIILKQYDDPFFLKEYFLPLDASIKTTRWESSNPEVAIVIDGYVYPVGVGQATIYSYAIMSNSEDEDVFASCVVDVIPELKALNIPSHITMRLTDDVTIPVSTIPANFETAIEWSSSNPEIAEVYDGKIIPHKNGTVNIIAHDMLSGITKYVVVTIADEIAELTGLVIKPQEVTLLIGESIGFAVSPIPFNAQISKITPSLSQDGIVNIGAGVVTAIAEGEVIVTIKDEETGVETTALVTVMSSKAPKTEQGISFTLPLGSLGETIDLRNFVSDDNTALHKLFFKAVVSEHFTVTIENGNATIVPKEENWAGKETIQFLVMDKDGNESALNIDFIMSGAENVGPHFAEIPHQNRETGQPFMPLNIYEYVSDDYSQLEDIMLESNSPENLDIALNAGLLEVAPKTESWIGTDFVTITATDLEGMSSSVDIYYTISEIINQAPVPVNVPEEAIELIDSKISFDLSPFITDDYTLPENIEWTSAVSSLLIIEIDGSMATITVANENWAGSEPIAFTATDEQGESLTFTINVNQPEPLNNTWTAKPSIDFNANRTGVILGTTLDFFGSITGGDADSWVWEFEEGEADDIYSLNPEVTYNTPGIFSVKLTAQNKNGKDSLVREEYISVFGITTPDTSICPETSAMLSVVADGADSFEWSTGESTPTITVSPTEDMKYYVTITDGFATYLDSVSVMISKAVDLGEDRALCDNQAFISDSGFAEYTWSTGLTGTESSIPITEPGTYSVTATDEQGCVSTDGVVISAINTSPVFSLGDDISICPQSPAELSAPVGDGLTYLWSTGAETASIMFSMDTAYSVTVTNNKGCSTADTVNVTVYKPFAEQIGVVTFSEDGSSVIVAWERTSKQRTEYYRVMRETDVLDEYEEVGTVPFNADNSIFVDDGVNATVQSHRYKLITVDSCGSEAESSPHRTIHVQTSYSATDKHVNLEWTPYEGFGFSTYKIYRGSTSENMEEVGSVTSEAISWTDINPLTDQIYRVAVIMPYTINPSELKTDTGPFSQSISNIAEVDVVVTGIEDQVSFGFAPNPTVNNKTVLVADGLTGDAKLQLIGTNSTVSRTFAITANETEIDLSNLPDGYYSAIIYYQNQIITIPLIVK